MRSMTTNPEQFDTQFCAFADKYIRPILDRVKGGDDRLIGSAITASGYGIRRSV